MSTIIARPIAPPSQQEIMQLVIDNMPAMRIYNPSPFWIQQMAGGIIFFIPPDLNGAEIEHKYYSTAEKPLMIKADGKLEIKSIYGKDKFKPIIDAGDIIRVITSSRGEMGLCFLPGGKRDEGVMQQAQAAWRQFRVYQAQVILAAWGEKLMKHEDNPLNKGKSKPIPPAHVLEAMRFQDYEASGGNAYRYQCECSYVSNDLPEFQNHLKVNNHKSITVLEPEKAKVVSPASSSTQAKG